MEESTGATSKNLNYNWGFSPIWQSPVRQARWILSFISLNYETIDWMEQGWSSGSSCTGKIQLAKTDCPWCLLIQSQDMLQQQQQQQKLSFKTQEWQRRHNLPSVVPRQIWIHHLRWHNDTNNPGSYVDWFHIIRPKTRATSWALTLTAARGPLNALVAEQMITFHNHNLSPQEENM